jgi:hypothetical protein
MFPLARAVLALVPLAGTCEPTVGPFTGCGLR